MHAQLIVRWLSAWHAHLLLHRAYHNVATSTYPRFFRSTTKYTRKQKQCHKHIIHFDFLSLFRSFEIKQIKKWWHSGSCTYHFTFLSQEKSFLIVFVEFESNQNISKQINRKTDTVRLKLDIRKTPNLSIEYSGISHSASVCDKLRSHLHSLFGAL